MSTLVFPDGEEPSVNDCYMGLKDAATHTPPDTPKTEATAIEEEENGMVLDKDELAELQQKLIEVARAGCAESLVPSSVPASNGVKQLPIHKPHAYPCTETYKELPSSPSKWPQRPVMLRPTPYTHTKIRGIRLSNSTEYQHFGGFCAGCILPINTGKEPMGSSLVIDFESDLFVGTLLMRIRDTKPPRDDTDMSNHDYFAGKKRKFQAIVKGKFKKELPLAKCVTGQAFDRPAGRLPAKWIVSSFVRFVTTLAPQLEATIEGQNPRFLTPLVATAQTVLSKKTEKPCGKEVPASSPNISSEEADRLVNYAIYAGSQDIEAMIEEPQANDPLSIVCDISPSEASSSSKKSVMARQKTRKKLVNALSAKQDLGPKFSLSKEYTFEFYQHLMLFEGDDLTVDMGRVIGKVLLAPVTNGQPVKFMAAYKKDDGQLDYLWCFDMWHQSLYGYAKAVLQPDKNDD